MSETIRIGIAGANAGGRHAQAFAAAPNADLVAIADPDLALRQPLADALSIPRQFDDAAELIAADCVDAIIVATPSYLHERHVSAAFDAGLHVLCESPIGINSGEASRLVTSAGLVNKTFMTSCPLRFDPRFVEARRLVEKGDLGEVFRGDCEALLVHWPHPANSWRLDRERGGGALLEAGLEALDLVWFVLGGPDPREAMAARYDLFSQRFAKEIDSVAEDTLSGAVRFKNGASLQVSAQIQHAAVSGQNEQRLRVWGSGGTLDLLAGIRLAPEGPSEYAVSVSAADCHLAQAREFLAAIAGEQEPLATGQQGLRLLKMTDALLASGKEKEAVSIKVERSLDDLFGGL